MRIFRKNVVGNLLQKNNTQTLFEKQGVIVIGLQIV